MSEHSDDPIRVARAGTVATIWLNRPAKRNAMNYSMWSRLEHVALELGSDRGVRVIVVRGAGEHFCAGADITELNVPRGLGERSFAHVNVDAEDALAKALKPTVAFVSGDCIGGGCALAVDCDLRICTADARFGITPAKLGIVYPPASLQRVTALIGPAATKRLLFTGDLIDAQEAMRIGLVDEVVDGEDAEDRLATLTGVLASRSLLTQAATKSMVAEILVNGDVSDAVRDEWNEIGARAHDMGEGIAAFVQKRSPHFTWSGRDDH